MITFDDLTIGKIYKREVLVLENLVGESIEDHINDHLRKLGHLYDLKVKEITIDTPRDPMYSKTATIVYSYVGVIDSVQNYMNKFISEFDIPINEETMVQREDMPGCHRVPLSVSILEHHYVPQKGDILFL